MNNRIQHLDNCLTMDTGGWSVLYDFLSDMMADMFLVFDFDQKCFRCIPNDSFILCGYTRETPVTFGYDYFEKRIHPDDDFFLKNVYNIIVDSFINDNLSVNQVNYFSFLVRIKSSFLSNGKSNYFMVYVKLKSQWENAHLRYGICILSASVIQKQDNQLFVYYKNMDYSNYSFRTKKWEYFSFYPLSNKQKEMLIWAQQGFSLKETAIKMNVSDKTIESMRHTLFEKFGVSSIEQAIQYAFNRRLIDLSSFICSEIEPKIIKQNKPK